MLNPQAFINAIAAKWSTRYPAQAAIIVRGAMLVLSDKVEARSVDSWRVIGSKGETYLVEVRCGFHRCSCPAFAFRKAGERCKHTWSVALYVRLQAELLEALDPKTIESFTEIPSPQEKKSTPKKKQSESLGKLCQKLHTENARRAALVVPCPVISIHQRRES